MKRTLNQINGNMIAKVYNELYKESDGEMKGNDLEHFSHKFEEWVRGVEEAVVMRRPANISLNKQSFLGKKTRALLFCVGISEPKTLGQLILYLWESHPEFEPIQ